MVDEKRAGARAGQTDEDLLREWRAGDQDAGDALLSRQLPALRRFSRRTPNDPDDFVQETLSRVVATRDRIRSGDRFRAYVLTIARHLLSELRRYSARGIAPSSSPAPHASPSQALAKQQQFQQLMDALRTLPEEHRNLLDLYYWQEVPILQMAARLGVPEGTVKSRLFSSRALLRQALERSAAEPIVVGDEPTGFDAWIRKISRVGPSHDDLP
ncbi:MAG: RNA polymerase sigma factor [Nannocystales bacterium]